MKRFFILGLTLVMLFALAACSGLNGDSSIRPGMSIASTVKLDKKGTIEIKGQGFAPGKEVSLLFVTSDGVESDIGYALDPAPVAKDDGTWLTKWSYGRFVKKKLVKEGNYTMTAVDEDFKVLCDLPMVFVQ